MLKRLTSVLVFHRLLKTPKAFTWEMGRLSYLSLEEPFHQAVFYESNPISVLERFLPGIGKGTLIDRHTSTQKQNFSIRKLSGLFAGNCKYEDRYPDLLAFSHKLTSGYDLKNRIGYQTDEDFERNCQYVQQREVDISAIADGEFRVYHRIWDERYFLINRDGAHHVSAIYRQCLEQDRDFVINAYLEMHRLNKPSCQRVLNNSYPLLVSKDCSLKLLPLLFDYGYFPPPYQCEYARDKLLLCLNRNIDKAEMVYQAIVTSLPPNSYFDVASWLNTLM